MDRGAWQAMVHRVTKSRAQLNDLARTRVCLIVSKSTMSAGLGGRTHFREQGNPDKESVTEED